MEPPRRKKEFIHRLTQISADYDFKRNFSVVIPAKAGIHSSAGAEA